MRSEVLSFDAVLLDLGLGLFLLQEDVLAELPDGAAPSLAVTRVLGCVARRDGGVSGNGAQTGQVQTLHVRLIVT